MKGHEQSYQQMWATVQNGRTTSDPLATNRENDLDYLKLIKFYIINLVVNTEMFLSFKTRRLIISWRNAAHLKLKKNKSKSRTL